MVHLKKIGAIIVVLCAIAAGFGTFMTSTNVQAQTYHTRTMPMTAMAPNTVYNISPLNASGSLCIGINGASQSSAAQTTLWTCNGNSDQNWTVDNITVDVAWVSFRIKNQNSGFCLGLNGGTAQEGANIEQFACNNNADQLWMYYIGPSQPTNQEFTDSLRNSQTGACLGLANGNIASGGSPIQWSCNGNADQTWQIF